MNKYTITIERDDSYMCWDDVLNDEPVDVLYFERTRWSGNAVFVGSGKYMPNNFQLLQAIESDDWQMILDESGAIDDMRILPNGRVFCEWNDYNSRGTYSNIESAGRAALKRENMADLRVESIDYNHGWGFLVYYQSELDKYTGCRDASSPIETCNAYIRGDIWGFDITDSTGESVDSCHGFIGDVSYCESEAQDTVDRMVLQDRLDKVDQLKRFIRNHVPLAYRQEVFAHAT